MRTNRVMTLALAVMAWSSQGGASEPCAPYLRSTAAGEPVLAVGLEVDRSTTGRMTISVEAGPIATRAVRVHSQPSNTLLVVRMDRAFSESPDGRAWLGGLGKPEALALSTSEELVGSRANLTIVAPPTDDRRIHVYVFGCWPDGAIEERLIADAGVRGLSFGFTSSVRMGEVGDDPTH